MTEFQKSTHPDSTSKEKLIVKIEEALNNRYVLEKYINQAVKSTYDELILREEKTPISSGRSVR